MTSRASAWLPKGVRFLFFVGLFLLSLIVGNSLLTGNHAQPRAVGADPHTRWRRGECTECHRPLDTLASSSAPASAPPRYHREDGWALTHGRRSDAQPAKCLTCHGKQVCKACHDRAPSSHVTDFKTPRGRNSASVAHAVLARIRPSACLICHGRFADQCTGCHSIKSLEEWSQVAYSTLEPWRSAGIWSPQESTP